mmetsp:Transcript_5641/g.13742  ORF Transcript_5641/g.13742 Transcript_5641/m.13742 type:complete len:245 (+) Transcript_5641:476-1210(+)
MAFGFDCHRFRPRNDKSERPCGGSFSLTPGSPGAFPAVAGPSLPSAQSSRADASSRFVSPTELDPRSSNKGTAVFVIADTTSASSARPLGLVEMSTTCCTTFRSSPSLLPAPAAPPLLSPFACTLSNVEVTASLTAAPTTATANLSPPGACNVSNNLTANDASSPPFPFPFSFPSSRTNSRTIPCAAPAATDRNTDSPSGVAATLSMRRTERGTGSSSASQRARGPREEAGRRWCGGQCAVGGG